MKEPVDTTPLITPPQLIQPNISADLEAGSSNKQCRICLDSHGRDFIAPCKCKGSAKYVHRECLDQWRSVKEGLAFSQCTTCKAPYYLRVSTFADQKWRTLKFHFFMTRDILFIFLAVQLVICLLGSLVYLVDGYLEFKLRHYWGLENVSFYYICGALLFFALVGLLCCCITCNDREVRNHLPQPSESWCCCCLGLGLCLEPSGTDSQSCFEGCCQGCASSACDEGCMGHAGEGGCSLLLIMGLIILGLFVVVGLFYSIIVATVVGQRIWQRHYHILTKKILTKDYIVEDVDGEASGSDWNPPPLPEDDVVQLTSLGLL